MVGKNRRRRIIWSIAGATLALGCLSLWLLLHYFGGKPELIPVPLEKMDAVANAVIEPQAMTGEEKEGVLQTLANVSTNVKAAVIAAATRKSIEELRRNFKGLKTMEEKKGKVREIMEDIDQNYAITDATYKLFSQEFIGTAMAVYMKDVSAEERALYDPIIHEFIRKMNTHRK